MVADIGERVGGLTRPPGGGGISMSMDEGERGSGLPWRLEAELLAAASGRFASLRPCCPRCR
jgi:hypothetical protein